MVTIRRIYTKDYIRGYSAYSVSNEDYNENESDDWKLGWNAAQDDAIFSNW